MGIEDQREEREVLESIFPDEITDVSETEFRISIQLDDSNANEEEETEPIIILLKVEYPPGYPDEAPRLDILGPPNAPKHEFFDVQEDKARLLESLEPTVEESMGMAMVFSLVSALKDAAEFLISERQNAAQALREVAAAKVEEEENRKFHGTQVNRETFLAWREKFREELADEERRRKEEQEAEDKKKRVIKEEIKMTGRQLWQRGLVGKVDEEEEGDDGLEDLVEKVKIGT